MLISYYPQNTIVPNSDPRKYLGIAYEKNINFYGMI